LPPRVVHLDAIESILSELRDACDALRFGEPAAYVYNPLAYAWDRHLDYWAAYRDKSPRVLWLGMNPGPFGMAQTGIPFGDVAMARDFVGVAGPVGRPPQEHPKRPVEGFDLDRSEVSGTRLWGWARDRFGTFDAFSDDIVIVNYCPLLFVHESGRNVIPEKLAKPERDALYEVCDRALRELVEAIAPDICFGIGRFAEKRLKQVLGPSGPTIDCILHPSPASPAANRGWVEAIEPVLIEHGIIA